MWRYLGSSPSSDIQDTIFIQVALLTLGWTDTKGLISLHKNRKKLSKINEQIND